MEKVFNYIFNGLDSHDRMLKDIYTILKRQNKAAMLMNISLVTTVLYARSVKKQCEQDKKELEKKIENLDRELIELKYSKGEPEM